MDAADIVRAVEILLWYARSQPLPRAGISGGRQALRRRSGGGRL